MTASRDIPGGTLETDRWRPPACMRHEHIFMVSPLVGPPLMGISPGIPCPVAPTALTSLAVSNEQTGFPCVQTLVAANTMSRPNSVPIRRMTFTSGRHDAYTTDQRVCRGRRRWQTQPVGLFQFGDC